ncbi:MBL fold metallo-hydrolase [Ramlibacter sp. H39-3-26]|uniref:MBL fold metallo-hydrolase n=1 Tax=Curvibacter soli TaxID=3031331 RepID=UPI0023DC0FE6|nr:MBL fold metallo-hydrolase [Ramlibacter sp. H39-3-26]MDF1486527.1 MBL fold metallo-hydrolase [Ramlibacter sp. H39-3-26]
MLRFRSLGSGSTGNAMVVEGAAGAGGARRLLVDCGFGLREIGQRLAHAGLCADDIHAIFVTHEHSDHIGCAHALALRHRIPVWMSHGTHTAIGAPDFDGLLRVARDGAAIDLGAFAALPFTVPHDAREPLQLTCDDGGARLGILTDLGHATPHVLERLAGCHALLLESNHDPDLLSASAYPPFLKRRVGGPYGHLANAAAADILHALRHPGLRRVAAAHLSERNNRPELARAALAGALQWDMADIAVADPRTGTGWLGC